MADTHQMTDANGTEIAVGALLRWHLGVEADYDDDVGVVEKFGDDALRVRWSAAGVEWCSPSEIEVVDV